MASDHRRRDGRRRRRRMACDFSRTRPDGEARSTIRYLRCALRRVGMSTAHRRCTRRHPRISEGRSASRRPPTGTRSRQPHWFPRARGLRHAHHHVPSAVANPDVAAFSPEAGTSSTTHRYRDYRNWCTDQLQLVGLRRPWHHHYRLGHSRHSVGAQRHDCRYRSARPPQLPGAVCCGCGRLADRRTHSRHSQGS